MNNSIDMNQLEKEIAVVETDSKNEEQYNADNNYQALDAELEFYESQIPYPDTQPYDTGVDYTDISRVSFEKGMNKPYWEKRDAQKAYCDNGSLYSGHIKLSNGQDYYFLDSPHLPSKEPNDYMNFYLVNADDKRYTQRLHSWRYPDNDENVVFSRNIVMKNREIENVDVILDSGNTFFSNITDAYLRKALIRNKEKTGVSSIIQSIQKKQDEIRCFSPNVSLVVQGCAGSGKTMVLLHRLRYLLFNNDIQSNEYLFLVPSFTFKSFVKNAGKEFRIAEKNIIPIQAYYQTIVGKEHDIENVDTDELLFTEDYLSLIYSKSFIRGAYEYLFDFVKKQSNELISYCEAALNSAVERATNQYEEEINNLKEDFLVKSKEILRTVQQYLDNSVDTFEDVIALSDKMDSLLRDAKLNFEKNSTTMDDFAVEENDDRLLENALLCSLKTEIDAEQRIISKASVFTVSAHHNKLEVLKKRYADLLSEEKDKIIEAEKQKRNNELEKCGFVFEGVSIRDFEGIVEEIHKLIESTKSNLEIIENRYPSITEYVGKTFASEIKLLNEFIESSAKFDDIAASYVNTLDSAGAFLTDYVHKGIKLLADIKKQNSTTYVYDTDSVRLFNKKTDFQIQANMNVLLFNRCKKMIKEKFGIVLCKSYKHYSYLELYCHYLTRIQTHEKKKYIFIDEGQDLNEAEIDLIFKLNASKDTTDGKVLNNPVINIFGDVNQAIMNHGIKDWAHLEMVHSFFQLDEDFRNPNQIIEFCNQNLPFTMKKIGVDMDEVSVYQTILDALDSASSFKVNPVIIVKDEYSKLDLSKELSVLEIRQYTCFTVKEVKGLEFKEVFVVDRDMTDNEKYISYTRALVKLNVIKNMDYYVDHKSLMFKQGEENDEEYVEAIEE